MQIYIPLCFYFIGFPSVVPMSRGKIYIPLCFYFIWEIYQNQMGQTNLHSTMLLLYLISSASTVALCPFTFHYASTLSKVLCTSMTRTSHLHSTMLLLYRSSIRQLGIRHLHLHSTMLLLYRWRNGGSKIAKCIYIPLCFYFIKRDEHWMGCFF